MSDATAPVESSNLCQRCTACDVKAALHSWDDCGNHGLQLGPFGYPVDEEKCDLCQVARLVVGYQDRHENHKIKVKQGRVGELFVIRTQNGIDSGYGHLIYTGRMETASELKGLDVACPAAQAETFSAPSNPQAIEWYTTYNDRDAISQTLKWLNTCISEHGCSDRSRSSSLPEESLFLLDVVDNNIVDRNVQASDNYFALSYVAGSYKTLRLSTTNQPELTAPGALMRANLAQTYKDAMSFTRRCGVRYLCIDALCIVHDDKAVLERQIDAMDRIYGKATLVLIAEIGTSPAFGLYPRQVRAHRKEIQDVRLRMRYDSGQYLRYVRTLKYWTRSWCFQEQFLSIRKLYFGAHWLRYHCDNINITFGSSDSGPLALEEVVHIDSLEYREETWAMQTISRAAQNLESISLVSLLQAYERIVSKFTERELSNSGDVERAFAGIASILRRIPPNEIVAAIPVIFAASCTPLDYWRESESDKARVIDKVLTGIEVDLHRTRELHSLVPKFTPHYENDPVQGSVLHFEAVVISASHFKRNYDVVRRLHVIGHIHICSAYEDSKTIAGVIMAITEGYEEFLETPPFEGGDM